MLEASEQLILYSPPSKGEWLIYRHSGKADGQWRLAFKFESEADAMKKYRKIFGAFLQGGIRIVDPEGRVIRDHYVRPLRWKP